MTKTLSEMGMAERLRRCSALEKQIKVLNDAYVSTMQNEREIMKGSGSLIRSAEQTLKALESRKAVDDHSPKRERNEA